MAVEDDNRAAAERRLGRVIAQKWRLEKVIGAGGMAAVYRASHVNNLKAVAIKMLHPELGGSGDLKRRFLREGYVANKVGHRGSVSIIDDGTDEDGAAFLVMELLEGETLGERAGSRGGTLSPREVLAHGDRILDVLMAAHAEGIVHRDLKPDNIFLTADGELKILDFGVARIIEAGEAQTRAGVVMGTPEYMAPEQARGRSEQVDGRTDIFAVGALMYRLITGKYVHEAETSNETLLRAMTEPVPKLATVLPDADPELASVIDTALEFDKEKRFADAKTMQSAVRKALDVARLKEGVNTLAGVPSPFAAGATGATPSEVIASGSAPTAAAETPSPDAPAADATTAEPSKKNLWAHQEASEKPHIVAKPPRTASRIGWVALVLLIGGGATAAFVLRGRLIPSLATAASAASSSSVVVDLDDDAGDDDDEDASVDADEPDATDAAVDVGVDAPRAFVPVPTVKKPPIRHPPRRRH